MSKLIEKSCYCMDTPVYDCVTPKAGDRKEEEGSFKCWSVSGSKYIPTREVIKTLPPGYYTPQYDSQIGTHFKKEQVNLGELYELPNKIHSNIIADIKHFWASKERYKKFGNVYKRNILIHSIPGTGKTSLITLLSKDLIENLGGIVISIRDSDDLTSYASLMSRLREFEEDRPIITILEDFDVLVRRDDVCSLLLNLLDGIFQLENVVTIATTNNPQLIDNRFLNRPSRFNLIVEYPKPGAEVRSYYMKTKLGNSGYNPEDYPIEEWTKKTEGYTMDHMKEFLQAIFVDEYSEDEALKRIGSMIDKDGRISNKDNYDKKVGF